MRRWGHPRKPPKFKVATPVNKGNIPKPGELTGIYKRIVTAEAKDRIQAMTDAILWYDAAMPFLLAGLPGKALDPNQQRTFGVATKARNLGMQGATDGEKETALLTCLRRYETIWTNTPKVNTFYDQYREKEQEFQEKLAKEKAKYDTVLIPLNTAFLPMGVSFAIQDHEKPRQIDVNRRQVLLSKGLMTSLLEKLKTEGVLPVLFSEASTALYTFAMEKDEQGSPKPNLGNLAKNIPVMLGNILQFASTVNPKSQLFHGYEGTVTATPVQAPAPKVRVNGSGVKPPKPVVPGKPGAIYQRGAKGAIWSQLTDEQPHAVADVIAGLKNGMERLRTIRYEGKQRGQWEVEITGGTVRLTILDLTLKP